MKNSTLGKILVRLLCGLIVIVKLSIISIVGFVALYVSQVMVYPSFCNVNGLGVRLQHTYDRLISTMGEPHKREVFERDNASNLDVFHYDGVIFFIGRERGGIVYIDIVGEQFTLGGPMWRRIGIGSTREEVEADFERRRENAARWVDRISVHVKFDEPHSLPNAGFGYATSDLWNFVEFEFDENDIVTRIRIGVWR